MFNYSEWFRGFGVKAWFSPSPIPYSLDYTPETSNDFLGISCFNKNPGTKKSMNV